MPALLGHVRQEEVGWAKVILFREKNTTTTVNNSENKRQQRTLQVARDTLPSYGCIRERAAAIRSVERCLSEFCIVWSTARLLGSRADEETKRDFLFHLRPLLEHAPARDRHEVRKTRGAREAGLAIILRLVSVVRR